MGRKVAMYLLTTAGDSWSGAQAGALEGATWMFGWRGMSLGGRWLARTPLAVRASEAVSYGASRVMDGLKCSVQGVKARVYHAATASVLSLEVMFSSIPRLPRVPGAMEHVVYAAPRVVDRVSPWAGVVDRARAVGSGAVSVVRPVVVQGVRGAVAGAVVNVPAYVVSFALTPEEVRVWDWKAFWGSEVTAAVGNGLGGFGSGVAGFVMRRGDVGLLRWRVVGGVVEYSWAVGSGYVGLFVGAGVSESSVSWGTVVYYGGFNIANNYIFQFLPGKTPSIQAIKGAVLAGFSDITKTYIDYYAIPVVDSPVQDNFKSLDVEIYE